MRFVIVKERGARKGTRRQSGAYVTLRVVLLGLALLLVSLGSGISARAADDKASPDQREVLARMNDVSKHLKTLSCDLEYTKVTVVVDDKSTEIGQLYYRSGSSPELLIDFKRPDPKTILLKKTQAEIYLPKINEIDEYDLGKHRELVQQFLLLGFGTDTGELQKSYQVKLTGEEDISGGTTAVLDLTPRNPSVSAQLAKVQLWISEESWLPVQQKFIEPGGDYLITRYSAVKVNRELPASIFQIKAPGAKRVHPTGASQ
jgi:outer membrane lipoprotein-sorting protein